jgi:hypothetical protein
MFFANIRLAKRFAAGGPTLTVTRSCGILTRFPCHNEANLQRPNLGLLLLHKAKSTHGIKNGSMIDRHLAEHLRDA